MYVYMVESHNQRVSRNEKESTLDVPVGRGEESPELIQQGKLYLPDLKN